MINKIYMMHTEKKEIHLEILRYILSLELQY